MPQKSILTQISSDNESAMLVRCDRYEKNQKTLGANIQAHFNYGRLKE